jgi:hypothetical protein
MVKPPCSASPRFSSTDTPPADSRATKVCCKHRGSRGRPNQLGGLDHRPVQPLPAQGVGPPRDRSRRQAACRLTHRRIDQLRGRRRGRAPDAVGLGSSPRDQRTRHDGDPVAARVHPGRHRQPPGLDRPAGSQPAHGAWRTRRPVQIPDPRSRQRKHPLLRNRIAVDCETGWKRCRGMTGKPFGTAQCHLRPLRPGDISVTNDLQRQTGQDHHGPGLQFLVELRGFEPLTPSMRTRCATGLRYSPWNSGQPSKPSGLSARSAAPEPGALRQQRSGARGQGLLHDHGQFLPHDTAYRT